MVTYIQRVSSQSLLVKSAVIMSLYTAAHLTSYTCVIHVCFDILLVTIAYDYIINISIMANLEVGLEYEYEMVSYKCLIKFWNVQCYTGAKSG